MQTLSKWERSTRLSLCSVMFMFWYVYVLLYLCFVMFVLCCVYVLLYLCFVLCIFCYAYVLFARSFLRDGTLWFLDSQSVADKGIKNRLYANILEYRISYKPTFSIFLLFACMVLLCLCFVCSFVFKGWYTVISRFSERGG